MSIARTKVTEGPMDPELFAWSSSFEDDRMLVREDLVGSAAHATMLGRTEIIEAADARALRAELVRMLRASGPDGLAVPLAPEEDVHMAVEAHLGRSLGSLATRLHAARSRNDQVALDLRLHVRDRAAEVARAVARLARALAERARAEKDTILPAYTHRQRAQPVSAAFLLAAWATGLLRAGNVVARALAGANELPLGSGACSGTSLPIDRALVARLLAFPALTANALDTVGDRDFLLDYAYAGVRVLLALGKLSTDLIDFATNEFALVRLGGEISAGSSMMPQKKNPDIFELTRAKTSRGVGNVVALLTLVKGLGSGYNRDQQEDRAPTLSTGPLVLGTLAAVERALPYVTFDGSRGEAMLAEGFTQATDLVEALVKREVPFRKAYQAVGELVAVAVASRIPLSAVPVETSVAIHPALDAEAMRALDPRAAVAAKESPGGTGPHAVDEQLVRIDEHAGALERTAGAVPSFLELAATIEAEPL
jgi:argininosuccinate lyase